MTIFLDQDATPMESMCWVLACGKQDVIPMESKKQENKRDDFNAK